MSKPSDITVELVTLEHPGDPEAGIFPWKAEYNIPSLLVEHFVSMVPLKYPGVKVETPKVVPVSADAVFGINANRQTKDIMSDIRLNDPRREVTVHRVDGQPNPLDIIATSARSPVGDYNEYSAYNDKGWCIGAVRFQKGNPNLCGTNGWTIEGLLGICLHRMRAFQQNHKTACAENDLASIQLLNTINTLNKRTRRRLEQEINGAPGEPVPSIKVPPQLWEKPPLPKNVHEVGTGDTIRDRLPPHHHATLISFDPPYANVNFSVSESVITLLGRKGRIWEFSNRDEKDAQPLFTLAIYEDTGEWIIRNTQMTSAKLRARVQLHYGAEE